MTTTFERRVVPTEFEFRAEANGGFSFEGYALKWDVLSQNLGGFRERVRQGATLEAIENDDVRALFNHDPNLILGRNTSGTLELAEDSTGTHYRVKGGNQSYARDLAESMERGDVTQSSFGFKVRDNGQVWDEDEDGFLIRTLTAIRLFDVSPVTYPAYLDSTSGLVGAREALAEAEKRGLTPNSGAAPYRVNIPVLDNDLFSRALRLPRT